MKICDYCKTENGDYSNFCENCGAPLRELQSETFREQEEIIDNVYTQGDIPKVDKTGYISPLAIIGFILAFLIPIVGLILGVIDVAQNDGRSKGLSIAAICISSIEIIVLLVAVIIPIYWMIGTVI